MLIVQVTLVNLTLLQTKRTVMISILFRINALIAKKVLLLLMREFVKLKFFSVFTKLMVLALVFFAKIIATGLTLTVHAQLT